ncbi:MAG: PDZ domain-containing protein [bacterium]
MRRTAGAGSLFAVVVAVGLSLATLGAAYAADEGWLGVMLQPLTDDISQAMSLEKGTTGVLVADVVGGSPAEAAQIAKGDVIVEIDGKSIESPDDAIAKVKSMAPGDAIKLVVLRDGKREVVTATLGQRDQYEKAEKSKQIEKTYKIEIDDEDEGFSESGGCHRFQMPEVRKIVKDLGFGGGYIGVRLERISADLGSYFGVGEDEGALVVGVEDDSPAEEAGLLAGDVITKIDGESICCPPPLAKAVRSHEPGDKVELTLKRKGETRRLDVTVGEGSPMRILISAGDDPEICCPGFMGHGGQWCTKECMKRCKKGDMKGCMKHLEGMPGGMGKGACKGDGPRKVMVLKSPEGMAMDEPLKKECMEMMGPGGHMDDLKLEIEHLKQEIETLKHDLEAMKK